jgi:hypothetical protein
MTNGWVWPIWQRQSQAPSIERSGKAEAMTVAPFSSGVASQPGMPAKSPSRVRQFSSPRMLSM